MLKAAIMNKEVEKRRALDEAESLQVVNSLVKQRRDAIEQFTAGGRQDLVDREQGEIVFLQRYLPPAADEAAIAAAIEAAVSETGAAGPKDMGKVMKAVMARLAGLVGGRQGRQRGRKKAVSPGDGRQTFPRRPPSKTIERHAKSLSSILRAGASTAGVEAPSFFRYAGGDGSRRASRACHLGASTHPVFFTLHVTGTTR